MKFHSLVSVPPSHNGCREFPYPQDLKHIASGAVHSMYSERLAAKAVEDFDRFFIALF
jgi:hypothetical protein